MVRDQPVPFSHAHHVGGLGIDCRYCHTTVESSTFANIPPTKTCMNCHSQIWSTSPTLEPVRASFRTGASIQWTRVYDLPDFVYFNHSIHINKGIGCESCHGRVDRMPLTWQAVSLQMEWCLSCHRQPGKVREAARIHHHHGIPPGRRSGRNRPPAGEGIQDPGRSHAHKLQHVPPMNEEPKKLDLAAARARLSRAGGRDYWRSLEDLASTPEFRDLMEREFPRQAVGWSEDENPGEGRRTFLKTMGASLALAGLTACTRQPTEHIMPYVRQPEELIPGKPLFYATATTLNGVATGVLAESHEGRPTKIEGNPEHPASAGRMRRFLPGLGAPALRPRPHAGRHAPGRNPLLG